MKKPTHHHIITVLFALAGCTALYAAPKATTSDGVKAEQRVNEGKASSTKPNIVHIMIDDLGWQDIASHKIDGKPVYETPHMDRMTREGRRFTQAYSPAPTCAPTRVSFLRGQYPVNTGVFHVMGGSLPRPWRPDTNMITPYYAYGLADEEPTIADVLAKAGYFTGHIAKWHAGGKSAGYPFPLDQGFHFGFTEKNGRHKYYNDEDLWNPKEPRKNNFFGTFSRMKPDRLSDFATDAEDDPYQIDENGRPFDKPQDMALKFIKKHSDKAFFLNYAPYYVHGPIQTRDRVRFDKYLKKMGLKFPENPDPVHKRGGGPYGHTNPYYASMVDTVDHYVGQIISLLEETDDPRNPGHKLIENTYVILDSDNGGVLPYTDNTPLQGGKQNTYEGGVRVPFLVLGPRVPAGTVCHTPISLVDLFPTFMQIARAKDDPSLELDGCNIYDHLHGAEKATTQPDGSERKAIFWHFPMNSQMSVAMRKGPWKMVKNYGIKGGGNHKPSLELYQIYDEAGAPKDLSEENDVSGQHPEVYASMKTEMLAYLKSHKAPEPYRNPAGADVTDEELAAIAKVTGISSEQDKVSVSFEAGPGKNKVSEATLFYTLNPKPFDSTGGNREEWFQMKAEVGEGRAEAIMPPGATHAVIVLRDEKNFWIPSEPMVSVIEKDHKHNSSLLKNGYAWRPGFHALVKLGSQARESAKAKQLITITPKLDKALANAIRLLSNMGSSDEALATGVRELRHAIRSLSAVPESKHPALNRFPTEPLF